MTMTMMPFMSRHNDDDASAFIALAQRQSQEVCPTILRVSVYNMFTEGGVQVCSDQGESTKLSLLTIFKTHVIIFLHV